MLREYGFMSPVVAAALTDKQDISEKGQADGYASLDENAMIPEAQMPLSVKMAIVRANQSYATSPYFVMEFTTTTNNESITIPCQNIGTFNAIIDWGDNSQSTITTYNDTDLTHTFAKAGDHIVMISGAFPNIYFNNTGTTKNKLKAVYNPGLMGWTRLYNAFFGCSNLTTFVVGNTDTSNVTDIHNMMANWSSMTTPPDLTGFNTSNVTDMGGMMFGWSSMTTPPDLTGFNTSNVTNMEEMMFGWSSMTTPPDLTGFNTSNVTNMHNMMAGWSSMTIPPDLTGFNTSNVTDIHNMMGNWYAMTTPPAIDGWDIRKITNATNLLINYKAGSLTTVWYDAVILAYYAQSISGGGTGVVHGTSWHFGDAKYTGGGAVEAARTSLITNDGWIITDGGVA